MAKKTYTITEYGSFTREKDEDERIQAIRFYSLSITAIIYVAVWILKPVFQTWIVRFFSFEQCTIIFQIMALINMIPLYVLIFKSTLYIQNKQWKLFFRKYSFLQLRERIQHSCQYLLHYTIQ